MQRRGGIHPAHSAAPPSSKEIVLAVGAHCFLGEFTFGALEHEKAMKSLRLFAEEVMPDLRKFEVDALNYPNNGYRVWLKPRSH